MSGRYSGVGRVWGHPRPVTLKPVSRICRVFVSTFSAFAFSALLLPGISSDPCFFLGSEGLPHFPHFPYIAFDSLISKIPKTGFNCDQP